MKIYDLKKGGFFTLRPIEEPKESQVWIRGEYDRSSGVYVCTRFDNSNMFRYLRGDKEVCTGFTF